MTGRIEDRSAPGLAGRSVLIFGATGFLGSTCADAASAAGAKVIRVASRRQEGVITCDARDPLAVEKVIRSTRPEFCINAAGRTAAGGFLVPPGFALNGLITCNILRAIQSQSRDTRVVVVSSSAVYGANARGRISEDHPIVPTTDYAASKACADSIASYFVETQGVDALIARPFNLVGPREPIGQVCSALARQIAQGELTGARTITIGPTAPKRDFVDVRDAARALLLLTLHGRKGEAYNIASGRTVAVRVILELLLRATHVSFEIEHRERSLQGDVSRQCGSHRKLTAETGWLPEIALERTLADLLDYWRVALAQTSM